MPDPSTAEPFSAFMARALHDPEHGYYRRRIRTVGARGDFSTSATLSPLLGQTIANWLWQEAQWHSGVRDIIEIGAGDGSLMHAVRHALGWWRRRHFHWRIVETSHPLRNAQQARLGKSISWHEDVESALAACNGRALIYHNELLDAFPVVLLQRQDAQWREVCVTHEGREQLRPFEVDPLFIQDFHALNSWNPANGQRCELHVSVRDWLRGWAPHWQAGSMLTIDYGDVFPALYHRRPSGTLRAYLMQQRLEGAAIYANPGRQDITADINFSDYRAWAQGLGWEEAGYHTQAEFIRQHIRRLPNDARTAFLLHPDGAGGAFKCMIHRTQAARERHRGS